MDNTTKYHNKYRVESNRLKNWNYSSVGYYFVTICTKDKINYLGKITDRIIKLSDIGNKVDECWKNIPIHFPFVTLDQFVIMPNHIHGIIIINSPVETQDSDTNVETQNLVSLQKNNINMQTQNVDSNIETQDFASLQQGDKFGPQSKNLGSIIRGFKIGVKKHATINNIDFQWQAGFHDHVIRNEKSLDNIREYINNNVLKWNFDVENKLNTKIDANKSVNKVFLIIVNLNI